MESVKTDIRILKYENYVKNNPEKPYGYYCLGKLHMQNSNLKEAESHMKKALELDRYYTRAKLGLIEILILKGKYIKAVYLCSKYKRSINMRNIYKKEIAEIVSSQFNSSKLDPACQSLVSRVFLNYFINSAKRILKKQPDNPVLNLLFCIYCLHNHQEDSTAVELFKKCVVLDGLDDNMRWALIKALSSTDSAVLKNEAVAGKFAKLPDAKDCTADYTNIILLSALKSGKLEKALSILDSMDSLGIFPPPSSLWLFLYQCSENSVYNNLTFKCCSRLLKSGWVDKLVAATFIRLKDLDIAHQTDEEEKILKFYGYVS
jgi:pentatricopeptide repeat protein